MSAQWTSAAALSKRHAEQERLAPAHDVHSRPGRWMRAVDTPYRILDGRHRGGNKGSVLVTFVKRACAVLAARVERVVSHARDAGRPCSVVGGLLSDVVRSKHELVAENAALRQQLIVAARSVKRPAFRPHERGLLVVLASIASGWRDSMLLVKPDTILRWHRDGFRLFWRWKSKPRPTGPSRVSPEIVELIQRMAKENRLWGAERIRGELLKLGIYVAKRTIQRYLRAVRPTAPPRGQSWHSFLRNHTVWACDFLQIYDIWFRPIFAFFIVDINTKRVVHVAVTRVPTQAWTAQQLRSASSGFNFRRFVSRSRNDHRYGGARWPAS